MATTPQPQPQPRYAISGDASVAYQTFGTGAIDLVLVLDGFMTIEAIAEPGGFTPSQADRRANRG